MTTSRKSLKYHTVDAFTSTPFSGNQAAVIVLSANDPWPKDSFLLQVAAEFNYAETAYVRKIESASENDYDLRWFTPVKEVVLCGHATLASAYVLKNHPELLATPVIGKINFHTRMSGLLIVDISSDDGIILMDFPADSSAEILPKATKGEVAKLLGLTANDIVHVEASNHCKYAVIEVEKSVDISSLEVDTSALGELFPDNIAQGVTSLSNGGTLLCRVFASKAGIPEDPVTGSMYTVLGPYWQKKIGHGSFTARQCSKRGGDVQVRVGNNGRVIVGGNAIGIMEGTLFY